MKETEREKTACDKCRGFNNNNKQQSLGPTVREEQEGKLVAAPYNKKSIRCCQSEQNNIYETGLNEAMETKKQTSN